MKTFSLNFFGARRAAVGLMSVSGFISEEAALNMALTFRSSPQIRRLGALILRVSSGGGSLAAAQVIAEMLETARSEMNIRSVALVTDLAASAGFFVAQAADMLVASPASTLGNTGALLHRWSFEEALSRFGIKCSVISSSSGKAVLDPFQDFTIEHQTSLMHLVEDNADQFLHYLLSRRSLSDSAKELLTSGKLFSGRHGAEIGLVDELGGLYAAIRCCGELIGLQDPELLSLDVSSEPAADWHHIAIAWLNSLR